MPNYKIRRAGRLTHDIGLSEKNRGRDSVRRQLKRHSVALISLFVALASLGYNTWRNETSELHRNRRQAAFHDSRTWVTGWGKVAAIRDLTSVLPARVPSLSRYSASS